VIVNNAVLMAPVQARCVAASTRTVRTVAFVHIARTPGTRQPRYGVVRLAFRFHDATTARVFNVMCRTVKS
jgi:hypothetical protein